MTKTRKRRPKKSDQANAEKAMQILLKAMQENPQIEQTLWASACWSLLIRGYLNSGIPYEDFCRDFDGAKEFYKTRWEEHGKA